MSVNLNFGVTGFVAVKDLNDRELYRLPVQSVEEADRWLGTHNKSSEPGWGILKSSFIPVRVDNLTDLVKDLFLPTFVNRALRTENLFFKVIASIFAVVWDVLTLPVRLLIGLPIRAIQHCTSNASLPIEELINKHPHFAEVKEKGIVRLVAHVENTHFSKILGGEIDQNVAAKSTYDNSQEICLKALPWERERDFLYGQSLTQIFHKNAAGEWEH